MTNRKNISSGAKWEKIVGYSRAVRLGQHVWVTGTTAFDDRGEIVGENDPAKQTAQIFVNVEKALTQAGARISDIVRTRIFVVDIERDWEEIGRVHRKVFGDNPPATTMVEISRLIDPRMLVEIEADAYIEHVGPDEPGRVNDHFEP